MFVSSMSSEELYAEAMKDFSILQTKIDLFMDRCGKHYRQEHFIGRFTKRVQCRMISQKINIKAKAEFNF